MTSKKVPNKSKYSDSFEADRRLRPRFWDVDYCLLNGLVREIEQFAERVKSGMNVIDFGCGAKPYRRLFPENCQYIGIDTCSNPYADIIIEPGQEVPLPDATADCIVSTQVVYLIPEYTIYLRECLRLLRPEGRMFITTHGTWTYHPASGGDYYRFTQDGLRYVLDQAGFEIVVIEPVVGTLGTGLHLRQLVFSALLGKLHCSWLANVMNVFTNLRILLEEKLSPRGVRMSAPVIFAVMAKRKA